LVWWRHAMTYGDSDADRHPHTTADTSVPSGKENHDTRTARLRACAAMVGFWVATDSPVATERLARLGYMTTSDWTHSTV
jgi:hypothetical protein